MSTSTAIDRYGRNRQAELESAAAYDAFAVAETWQFESPGDESRYPPVLVALSAGGDSFGAIAVAEAIEQRYGSTVHSVYVFGHQRLALPARVPSAWAIHLDVGRAVNGILRCAHRTRAALIALGLRRHGVIDRLLHEETVLGVARRATVPTLAVVPGLRGLPHRAVVAVDFGPAGLRAARAARDLVARPVSGPPPLLRLAYIQPSRVRSRGAGPVGTLSRRTSASGDTASNDLAKRETLGRLGIEGAFEQLKRELDPPPYLRVDSTVLRGAPARALLNLAADSDADLIAIGATVGPVESPPQLGHVARGIIRAARCSVLVVPAGS